MKVHWTNEDFTEAILVRGWWNKKIAYVSRAHRASWVFEVDGQFQCYVDTVDAKLDKWLSKQAKKAKEEGVWLPRPKLPRARLLR